ncbi:MAG TPA: acyltransferase family protein [Acidimicrobiales bacterium]|nr:acyltransferase family protein [Acidimicrobiales bacterium]
MGGLAGNRYWPSLDGVRAIAVAAVVAYHLGYLGGGWIGVDVFFVLSGFLITSLLLHERARTGAVRLRAFWARRAKRLLPALFLVTGAVALYAWLGGAAVVPAQLRSPAVATLFYVANWQQIGAAHGYFAHYQAPSPFQHTWSLAIEEQYYLVWPLLFLGLTWLARRRTRRGDRVGSVLFGATAALALASVVWMGVAAHVDGVNRAYLGTDTRAWELLVGGLGAMALAGPARHRRVSAAAWSTAAVVGSAGVAAGLATAGGPPGWIWRGGLAAIALGALVVILSCVTAPHGPVARVLAFAPLRFVGRISYSLYLWHWPVIVVLTPATTGQRGATLVLVRLAAMFAGATASYELVERPLRRADWSLWWRRALVPLATAGTLAVVIAATVPPVAASTARLTAAPTTKSVSDPVPALPFVRVPSRAQPLRVWMFGDSVMADSGPGITAALQATGDVHVVADSAFGGWGLSTARTWPADNARIIANYHPELAIATWSWDDQWAQTDPAGYEAQLVSELNDILSTNGVAAVVLLQFPQTGPSPYYIDPAVQATKWTQENASQVAWNNLARRAVASFPGRAVYLDTQQLFAPGGRFYSWFRTPDGRWVRARKLDNTHMCPYGAAEFGALVAQQLTPVLHLAPLAAGWQLGSWVDSPNYDDPAGSCPADQPPARYTGVAVPGLPS